MLLVVPPLAQVPRPTGLVRCYLPGLRSPLLCVQGVADLKDGEVCMETEDLEHSVSPSPPRSICIVSLSDGLLGPWYGLRQSGSEVAKLASIIAHWACLPLDFPVCSFE